MINVLFFIVLFILNVLIFLIAINTYQAIKMAFLQQKILSKYKNTKAAYQKRVDDMRAAGEMHEWITLEQVVRGETNKFLVCKKTGWCPEINDFFLLERVAQEVEKQEREAAYEKYRNEKLNELSKRYNIPTSDLENISESIFDIKKQFALLWIDKKSEQANEKSN